MDTLIFFSPAKDKTKVGHYDDIIHNGKKIRIIYHADNPTPLQKLIFSLKIRKLTKNACFFQNNFSSKYKGKKIYHDGAELALYHLPQIFSLTANGKPIVVLTSSITHIYLLKPLIMKNKNITFLTHSSLKDEFSEKLLDEYGIGNGCQDSLDFSGKATLIMPGGELFQKQTADAIINLSKGPIPWQCTEPDKVIYKVPGIFKNVKHIFRNAPALETALCFLGMDFSCAKPISVNFNKQKV